ncbi:DUF3310 domain-containing protein [Paenibacillus sp. FSL M8-0228]|uniref:DUF3310 domain-containing protein n=1 Tax=Paenibacillus sp. FSL M8-0228 TaxID=2921620 RepID=UPI004046F66A
MSDAIRPSHYDVGVEGEVECLDAIKTATKGLSGLEAYTTGACIKYLWRWKRKNGVEDLRKTVEYIERLIQDLEDNENGSKQRLHTTEN